MHTCYSLCTNEVLNLGLANLNHPTRLLLSLALQKCFSAEQMGKRAKLNEWNKYFYSPLQNIPVGVQLSIFGVTGCSGQSDQMRLVSSQRLHCVIMSEEAIRETEPTATFDPPGPDASGPQISSLDAYCC